MIARTWFADLDIPRPTTPLPAARHYSSAHTPTPAKLVELVSWWCEQYRDIPCATWRRRINRYRRQLEAVECRPSETFPINDAIRQAESRLARPSGEAS